MLETCSDGRNGGFAQRWISLRKFVFFPIIFLLAGCSGIQLNPQAQNVRLYIDSEPQSQCTFLGEAIGTYGNIWTFIFIPNEVLIESALNDIKNEAHQRGADTVYLMRNQLNFSSSVTLLGQMYRCR